MVTFVQMVDYLIVGLGLAGVSFCEKLSENGKSFKVISDSSQNSSLVAGGLYNPVILKRFTLAWKADEQLQLAKPFYNSLERKLGVQLDNPLRIFRRFNSIEEQNQWFEAADKKSLSPFLSTTLHSNKNESIDAPLGYGEVLNAGRIDTRLLIQAYNSELLKKQLLIQETFQYQNLLVEASQVVYKDITAKRIVFAEGYGLKANPYFNYLPVNGSKGEYVIIKSQKLNEEKAIKSSLFVIPLGDDLYQVGANYEWKDKTNSPTPKGRDWVLERLDKLIRCDYEVVGQMAGVRPTVSDRRPLIGAHPEKENLFLLNGFGSRGVLIAPFATAQLYNFIENGGALEPEMDVNRFSKKWVSR